MADDVRSRCDTILRQCFQKVVQVILQSRFSSTHDTLDDRTSKWFNIEMKDLPSINALATPWKTSVQIPLVVDVYFDSNTRKLSGSTVDAAADLTLLEHWVLRYDESKPGPSDIQPPTVYKMVVLLMRSLYSLLRVLPAFRLVRACRKNKMALSKMSFQVSKTQKDQVNFGNESSQNFSFGTVPTPFGQLSLNVEYRSRCDMKLVMESPSNYIIQDYHPPGNEVKPSTSPSLPVQGRPVQRTTSSFFTRESTSQRTIISPERRTSTDPIGIPGREQSSATSFPGSFQTASQLSSPTSYIGPETPNALPPIPYVPSTPPFAVHRSPVFGGENPFSATSPPMKIASPPTASHFHSGTPGSIIAASSFQEPGSYQGGHGTSSSLSGYEGGLFGSSTRSGLFSPRPTDEEEEEDIGMSSLVADLPAFMVGPAEDDEDSEIAKFVRYCRSVPPLNLFGEDQNTLEYYMEELETLGKFAAQERLSPA